jgi:hypothetical protein
MGQGTVLETPPNNRSELTTFLKANYSTFRSLRKNGCLHQLKYSSWLKQIFLKVLDHGVDIGELKPEEIFALLAIVNIFFHNGFTQQAKGLKVSLQLFLFLVKNVQLHLVRFHGRLCVVLSRGGWESHLPVDILYRVRDKAAISRFENRFGKWWRQKNNKKRK